MATEKTKIANPVVEMDGGVKDRAGGDNPNIREVCTMPAAIAGSFEIADDVGPISSLITFDIRNGSVKDAHSLLIKPIIGSPWHWRPVTGLEPLAAKNHVDAYIRTYRCVLADLPDATYPAAVKRKLAIVLGVARAVATSMYNLEVPNFVPGELGNALLQAVAGADGNIRFETVEGVTDVQMSNLTEALNFSEEEKAAISSIHMCAIGLLPLQGYSLMNTGHHYLSDKSSQSYRAFALVERQFWTDKSVKRWWDADVEILRDALFHKAGHPVSVNLKRELVMSPDICEMIKRAGAGSAAARLPAVEPEMRTAITYRALCQTVQKMFESYGGSLNFDALDRAIETVKLCKPGVAAQIAAADRHHTVPDWVNDRSSALEYLKQVVNGNSYIAAYCYGFYVAPSEASQAAGGTIDGSDTLRTSYSLSKLAKQNPAAYIAGREAYGDYAAHERKLRGEGEICAAKAGVQ